LEPILPAIESLLLTATRVVTYDGQRSLTNASGFFFERAGRLFFVTSRHVLLDKPSKHFPDRIVIELHTDAENMARSTGFSMPLYRGGKSLWRQGLDTAGEIDVALIEIERATLPETTSYRAFTPDHLHGSLDQVERSARRCWWWAFRSGFTTRCTTCPWCAMRWLRLRSVFISRVRDTSSPMHARTGA
jgi:hypothetical protein